jgi:hypothetical protein
MYLQKVPNKQKIYFLYEFFLLAFCRSMAKIAGSGSISQRHGSADTDPDPHQNVMDPQHCFNQNIPVIFLLEHWSGGGYYCLSVFRSTTLISLLIRFPQHNSDPFSIVWQTFLSNSKYHCRGPRTSC